MTTQDKPIDFYKYGVVKIQFEKYYIIELKNAAIPITEPTRRISKIYNSPQDAMMGFCKEREYLPCGIHIADCKLPNELNLHRVFRVIIA